MILCKPQNDGSRDNRASPGRYFLTDHQVPNHTVPTGRVACFLPFQALRARLPSFSPYGTQTRQPIPLFVLSAFEQEVREITEVKNLPRQPRSRLEIVLCFLR
jgi:hypothetical protein